MLWLMRSKHPFYTQCTHMLALRDHARTNCCKANRNLTALQNSHWLPRHKFKRTSVGDIINYGMCNNPLPHFYSSEHKNYNTKNTYTKLCLLHLAWCIISGSRDQYFILHNKAECYKQHTCMCNSLQDVLLMIYMEGQDDL